jgi:hypothetical protein
MPKAKKAKTNNAGIFVEQSTESRMILELRERKRQTETTFEKLQADHQEYIAKYGKTWLSK